MRGLVSSVVLLCVAVAVAYSQAPRRDIVVPPPHWNRIVGKPTTFPPGVHTQDWSTITGTPTTVEGYGITNAFDGSYTNLTDVPATFPPSAHQHDYTDITNAPWKTEAEADLLYLSITNNFLQAAAITNLLAAKVDVTDGVATNLNVDGLTIEGELSGDNRLPLTGTQYGATNGLVAWYRLDGDAKDSAGSNDGTWTGTEAYTNAIRWDGGEFDGASHVQFDTRVAEWTNAWTAAFWQYHDISDRGTTSAHDFAISYGHGGVSDFSTWGYFAQRPLGVYTRQRWQAYDGAVKSVNLDPLPSSGWHHITLRHNGDNTVSYFVNSTSNTTFTTGFRHHPNSNHDKLELGAARQGAAGFFHGALDEVRIYNRALSASEITELYERDRDWFKSHIDGDLDVDGDARIGGDLRVDGAAQIGETIRLANTTKPTALTGFGWIYAKTNEVYVLDGAGNETLISPHSGTDKWGFYSINHYTGREISVDMESMVRALERVSGEKLMQVSWREPTQVWGEDEAAKVARRNADIAAWDADAERRQFAEPIEGEPELEPMGERPEPYTPKPVPQWITERLKQRPEARQ